MTSMYFKKGIAGLLIVATLATNLLFLQQPKKVEAQMATTDIGNQIVNTISSIGSGLRTGLQTSLGMKEFTLDALAYAIAKQILRQITTDTVNWINSGFQGNPAFVADPAGFFLGLGDEVVGRFLESMELTNFLCSPFSIDVRLALAFRYRPFAKRVPTCSLTEVIQNTQGAIAGANINGFTAGDFKQGGWPAFVSMTTEPQNNQYGAFIEADTELALQIGNKRLLKQNDLFQGKGFLSWEKCTETGGENHSERADQGTGEGDYDGPERSFEGSGEGYVPEKKCETQTPGSVIAGQLETTLGSPVRELELADELNEIINALFAQMIKQIITGGLRALSGRGPSDPDAYITRLQNEKDGQTAIGKLITGVLQTIDRYIDQLQTVGTNKESSYNYVNGLKLSLEESKVCFINKLNTSGSLTQAQKNYAQEKINEATTIINTKLATTTNQLLAEANLMDSRYERLTYIKYTITSATSTKAANDLAVEFNNMVASPDMVNEEDVVQSGVQYSNIRNAYKHIESDVTRLNNACQMFPVISSL